MTLKSHGGGEYRSWFFSSEKEGFGLHGAVKEGGRAPVSLSQVFRLPDIIIMVDLDSLVTLYFCSSFEMVPETY